MNVITNTRLGHSLKSTASGVAASTPGTLWDATYETSGLNCRVLAGDRCRYHEPLPSVHCLCRAFEEKKLSLLWKPNLPWMRSRRFTHRMSGVSNPYSVIQNIIVGMHSLSCYYALTRGVRSSTLVAYKYVHAVYLKVKDHWCNNIE